MSSSDTHELPAPPVALSPEERALLIGPFSGPPFDSALTRDETLQQIFAETALRSGARPAIEEDGLRITYAELEATANRIAHLLRARGVGRGSLVGHWFPRGATAYAILLGILKAGAAYVPLDPELPPARVRQVATECRMDLLLAPAAVSEGAWACLSRPGPDGTGL